MPKNKMTSSQFIELCEEGERLAEIIISHLVPNVYPIKRSWKKIDVTPLPIKRSWKKIDVIDLPVKEPWPLLQLPEGYVPTRNTERRFIEDTERWYTARKLFNEELHRRSLLMKHRAPAKALEGLAGLDEATGYSVFTELYEEYYDAPFQTFLFTAFNQWLERVYKQVEEYHIAKVLEELEWYM